MSSSLSRNDSSSEEGENEFNSTPAIFPKTNDDGCSSNRLDDVGQQLLKRINVLEAQQRQNEAVTKEMFDQHIKQLQNEQKAFFGEWEKNQQKQEEKWTNALADQLEAFFGKMEEKQQKQEEKWTNAMATQLELFFDKKGKMEKKQQQKNEEIEKSFNDQFSQLHNEKKTLLGKISDLEKQHQMLAKQMKTDSGVKFNCWDVNACHNDLKISGPTRTMVHRKGSGNAWWRTVFAKYSILHSAVGPSNIFYFELKVKNLRGFIFGIAVKHQTPLHETIKHRTGTYAYEWDGDIYINGSRKYGEETFGTGDTVGCGVNLANNQVFFTKNGHQIDNPNECLISSSHSAHFLFPFVSLDRPNDKIVANFGPEFMYDLSTLC